jgi:hypothetical protein
VPWPAAHAPICGLRLETTAGYRPVALLTPASVYLFHAGLTPGEVMTVRSTDPLHHPSSVPASGATDTSRCTAWLGAFALGLAHTERCDDDCIEELLTVAAGSAARLREAAGRLTTLTDADAALRARAVRLLLAAAQQGQPRSSVSRWRRLTLQHPADRGTRQ